MLLLVFDTETTGLPKTMNKNVLKAELHLWPQIVQFSYIIFDTTNNEIIQIEDHIILVSIPISDESTKIHGITNEISLKNGKTIDKIINKFVFDMNCVDVVIGHNLQFDLNMVESECLRNESWKNIDFILNYNKYFCTMLNNIELCGIKRIDKKGKTYNKYPSLSELHQYLYGIIPNNLHNSLHDILICLRCFVQIIYKKDIYKINTISPYFSFME